MTRSHLQSDSGVHPSGALRGRFVRPLALLAVAWAAACGGDGGTTDPEPAPQPNRPPVASASLPDQSMTAGESATVSVASTFSDPDGDALTYTAISSNAGVAGVALTGTNLTITAVSAGTASVTVTARDPAGLSAAASANVTIVEPNRPPVAAPTVLPSQSAVVGDTLRLDVSPFFSDPDGDALTYSASSSNTSLATVVSVAGSVVSAAAVGAGTAFLTVEATDPDGLSGSLSVPVTIEPNRPPEARGDSLPAQTIQERDSVTVRASSYFTDPNGDALTYTAELSNPGVATVSVSDDMVTITAAAIGPATLTLTATDPGGLTASLTGSVTVIERVNRAPEAQGQVRPATMQLGASGMLELEGEDPIFVDSDGDALTYSAESSVPSVVTASVTESVVTVTAETVGMAVVTVTATDPGGLSASVTFDVTVIPTAEVILRDDFDDDGSLDNWVIVDSQAEVAEGVLRLSDPDSTAVAVAEHPFDASITDWEVSVRMGQASDSASTAVVFVTGDARIPFFRVGVGDWTLNFSDGETVPTNYRFAIYDTEGSQDAGWYFIRDAFGVSDLISAGSGEFTEITVELGNGRMRVLAGGEVLLALSALPDWFPTNLTELDLLMINLRDDDEDASDVNTSLFDWVEVNGVPTESSSTNADGAYRYRPTVPSDFTRNIGEVREASALTGDETPARISLTPGRR